MKKFLFIILILALLSIFVFSVFAAEVTISSPIKHKDLVSLIEAIAKYVFAIGIVLCPIFIVWGGILIMTSGGDPTKYTLGKNVIICACIGLAIVLFSKGIVAIVKSILGVAT